MGLKTFLGKCGKDTMVKVVFGYTGSTIYETCRSDELYPDMTNNVTVAGYRVENNVLVVEIY